MALSIQEMHEIPQEIQDIVFGWIKQTKQEIFPSAYQYEIPPLINYVILLYYYHGEYFSKHGSNLLCNDTKDVIKLIRMDDCSAYGNIMINNKYHKIYQWKFKIIEGSRGICIGIDSSNKLHINERFQNGDDMAPQFYGYGSNGRRYEPDDCNVLTVWTKEAYYKTGDTVKMICNTMHQTLEFWVNSKLCVTWNNIDFDQTKFYHMAISLYSTQDSLKLIDFHQSLIDE